MVNLGVCTNLSVVGDIAMRELAAYDVGVLGKGCKCRRDDFNVV